MAEKEELKFEGHFKAQAKKKGGWREIGMDPDFTLGAYSQTKGLTDKDFSSIAVAIIAKKLGVKVIYSGGLEIRKKKAEKLCIAVEVFQGVVQDVHVFKTRQEAEKWFEKYTGLSYENYYAEPDTYPEKEEGEYNEDFEGTKIFEVEL